MKDILVGLVAVLVGSLFCFRGWLAMRVVIPIWGAFAGFVFGAGLIDAWFGDGFLRTALGWVVGFVFAAVFFFLAYLYFEIAVVLAMSFVGFAIGTALMTALGIGWNWVVVAVGLATGVALAWLAIVVNLPMGVLTVLTALGGASTIVGGVMLVFGTIDTDDFEASVTEHAADNPWWYVLFGALVVAGIVSQIAFAERLRVTLRDAWADAGGRQFNSR